MLRRLIEFSLSQRLLVLLAALALAAGGAWAFMQLPIDAYPNIAPTQVKACERPPRRNRVRSGSTGCCGARLAKP